MTGQNRIKSNKDKPETLAGVISQSAEHQRDTFNLVKEILDYTEEDKETINDLVKFMNKFYDLIIQWKTDGVVSNYIIFCTKYENLDIKLKSHFEEIKKDLTVKVWIFKINRILENPLPSWLYDIHSIKVQIGKILSVDEKFDFSIFNSDIVSIQYFQSKS